MNGLSRTPLSTPTLKTRDMSNPGPYVKKRRTIIACSHCRKRKMKVCPLLLYNSLAEGFRRVHNDRTAPEKSLCLLCKEAPVLRICRQRRFDFVMYGLIIPSLSQLLAGTCRASRPNYWHTGAEPNSRLFDATSFWFRTTEAARPTSLHRYPSYIPWISWGELELTDPRTIRVLPVRASGIPALS